MDYASEQQMELEALEAIFMDDLQVYNGTLPSDWKAVGNTYIITILPLEEGEELEGTPQEELQMELLFAHTEQYPEEAPCLKLQPVYGLSDSEVARCYALLQEQVQQNLGMAMIYTLITAAKEWLRDRAAQTVEEDPEVAAKKAAEEEEARRAAARAHGTHVTVEAFMEWKAQHDAALAAAKAKAVETAKDDEKAKRMTGKAYFLAKGDAETITEPSVLSGDEEDFSDEERDGDYQPGMDEDEEDDIDYDDDDDEGMLDELDPTG